MRFQMPNDVMLPLQFLSDEGSKKYYSNDWSGSVDMFEKALINYRMRLHVESTCMVSFLPFLGLLFQKNQVLIFDCLPILSSAEYFCTNTLILVLLMFSFYGITVALLRFNRFKIIPHT